MDQNSQKTLVSDVTELSEILTGTLELDLSSYDELKSRQVANEFINSLNNKSLKNEEEEATKSEEPVGERRRHDRIASALPAQVYTILSNAPFSHEPTPGFVVNLSLTGLAIVSESDSIQRGDVVEIEVMVANGSFSLTTLVVKKTPVLTTAVAQVYYGLRIIKMSPNALGSIEALLGFERAS